METEDSYKVSTGITWGDLKKVTRNLSTLKAVNLNAPTDVCKSNPLEDVMRSFTLCTAEVNTNAMQANSQNRMTRQGVVEDMKKKMVS